MTDHVSTQKIHGHCGLCIARCGTIATVEDGRFTRLDPDPSHPTGQAICAKGRAAPELVYHPERLTRPLRRTRPKGDSRSRLGADLVGRGARPDRRRHAADQGAARGKGGRLQHRVQLDHGDRRFGALRAAADECVRHAEPCTAASTYAAGDAALRPNTRSASAALRSAAARGAMADIANSGCLILWGYNPSFSRLTHATATVEALQAGHEADRDRSAPGRARRQGGCLAARAPGHATARWHWGSPT